MTELTKERRAELRREWEAMREERDEFMRERDEARELAEHHWEENWRYRLALGLNTELLPWEEDHE
jgi:uncharacterized coiled-coil DUF342 family protein